MKCRQTPIDTSVSQQDIGAALAEVFQESEEFRRVQAQTQRFAAVQEELNDDHSRCFFCSGTLMDRHHELTVTMHYSLEVKHFRDSFNHWGSILGKSMLGLAVGGLHGLLVGLGLGVQDKDKKQRFIIYCSGEVDTHGQARGT